MNKLQNKIKYKSLQTKNRTLKLDSVFCETPCSNERNVEEKRVFEALRNNGYPRKFLREVCNKVKSNSIQDITKASTESESTNGLVILSYIKGTTEQLKRVLLKHKFKVATKPMFTLRSQLMRPKDALGDLKQSGVVYNIPREDCDVEYIGETGRVFGTWQDKHERAVRLEKGENSALGKHVHDEDHSVAWKKSRILCKENRWAQRKWKEACFIEHTKNGMANRDNGMTLQEVYKPIVRSLRLKNN